MGEHAIFSSGGKQYRVKAGDIVKLEKLAGDAGAKIEFDQVFMAGEKIGSPLVPGARVFGEVVAQDRADKILVFKKKRRQNYRRTRGHRRHLTIVKITEIKG